MVKTVEFTGRTEEEAIANGLKELGLERDDVSVEIVERHKSGFLGIGSTPAKVKISYGVSETERVETFLKGLVERMGSDAVPHATLDEETGTIKVEFTGSDLGILIGRRGETLDAIQHLANDVINRGQSKRTRITVDAENYRAKREEALKKLALKIAGKVRKYRRNVTLEAMNSYERHIIHMVLQDEPEVTTFSIGSDANRRVVVAYSRDKVIGENN